MLNILLISDYLFYILTVLSLPSSFPNPSPQLCSPPNHSISLQKMAASPNRYQQDMPYQVAVGLTAFSCTDNDSDFHNYISSLKLSYFINLLFWTGSWKQKLYYVSVHLTSNFMFPANYIYGHSLIILLKRSDISTTYLIQSLDITKK